MFPYLHDDFNIIILRDDIPAVLAKHSLLVGEEPVGFEQTREVEFVLAACNHARNRSTWLLTVLAVLFLLKTNGILINVRSNGNSDAYD